MGFMDKIKNVGTKIRGAANWAKDKIVNTVMPRSDVDAPPLPVDTRRYLHVSVPLVPIDNAILRKILGRDYMVTGIPGHTRMVGNNQMKRVADSLGANNKERRRLRAKMKRRAAELRAGASLQPYVQATLAGAA